MLKFWREIDAFQTSLKLSEGRPIYSFYDGPPFATGLPHYGHLLAGTIKVRNFSSPIIIIFLRTRPLHWVFFPFIIIIILLIGGCAGGRGRKTGRTSSRAMRTSRASTCRGVSAGTRTACPSSTRSTRSSASRRARTCWVWASTSTTPSVARS